MINIKINNIQHKQTFRAVSFSGKPQIIPPTENLTDKKKTKNANLPVILTTIAGTILPIFIIRKYQGKTLKAGALKGLNPMDKGKAIFKSFNIEYELKEMLLNSFGSIAGGLAGGLLFKKDENKKPKIKESLFQFANIAIPTSITDFLLKQAEKSKNFKGAIPKIASAVIGIGVGMPLAAIVSDKINNSIVDKENPCKRKLKIKDCFVHVDDLVQTLVLCKVPLAGKLHVEKLLPLIYGSCGYESGTKKG